MEHLEFPLLTSRIVSGLTGLSARTLRQWEDKGILPAARRRTRRSPRAASGAPRLYSWRDVEQLQQATHLIRRKRLPMAEVKRLLEQSQSASLDHEWVIDRHRPRVRHQPRAGGNGYAGTKRARTPTRQMR
jgi:DNA-binding transcriptional MerR regulator